MQERKVRGHEGESKRGWEKGKEGREWEWSMVCFTQGTTVVVVVVAVAVAAVDIKDTAKKLFYWNFCSGGRFFLLVCLHPHAASGSDSSTKPFRMKLIDRKLYDSQNWKGNFNFLFFLLLPHCPTLEITVFLRRHLNSICLKACSLNKNGVWKKIYSFSSCRLKRLSSRGK